MINNCNYEEGCSLPSSNNELEILMRNLKREVKELATSTETKLLRHDGKIAEMCKYIKDNLSNSIRELIDNMDLNGELDSIISDSVYEYVNKFHENFMLSCYFDVNDNNKINFYVSKDGVNLNKLIVPNNIYGRDPSIAYYNGLFYIGVTDYDSNHDFVIYTSKDLKSFERHNITIGLHDVYSKVWAPNLFFDEGKLIVHVAKQYGPDKANGGEGDGIFKIYKTECINLNTLKFSQPISVPLSNSSNYIDSRVFKYNNVYYMVVKNEKQSVLSLDLYSSTNLKTWDYIENPSWNMIEHIEGASITEFNGYLYLIADRYAYPTQSIIVSRTKDLTTFTDFVEVNKIGNESLRHGSSIACYSNELKTIVSELEDFNFSNIAVMKEDITKPRLMLIGSEVEGHLNKFIKLFSVKFTHRWKNTHIMFRLMDSQQNKFDNIYNLNLWMGADDTLQSSEFKNISNSSNTLNDDLFCIKTGHNEWSVYLRTTLKNISACMQILSYSNFGDVIKIGSNKCIDTIDTSNAIKPIAKNDYLKAGIPISNCDLNDLLSPGVYYCYSQDNSLTISNKPNGVTTGFRVENMSTNGNIIIQKLIAHNEYIEIYYRYYSNEGGWYRWRKLVLESVE